MSLPKDTNIVGEADFMFITTFMWILFLQILNYLPKYFLNYC